MEIDNELAENGYAVINCICLEDLEYIKSCIAKGMGLPGDNLKDLHRFRDLNNDLNKLRVDTIRLLNNDVSVKKAFWRICAHTVKALVGPDVAMQRKLNLSIQLPGDDSSLLDIHADTWSGDSPYEIVAWLPMMDVSNTGSMYMLPCHAYREFLRVSQSCSSADDLWAKVSHLIEFLEVPYGSLLVFNQCLPHGNLINKESYTRFSINCRFKSLFSPYGLKSLGDFFEIVNESAVAKFARSYKLPEF
jgi:sporadic carbohydrate cluster 2OG-Fe(II) oxygenase